MKKVQWLGVQSVDVRLCQPAIINPICMSADALGVGLPERDLHVSPDHGIVVDGVLVNAPALGCRASYFWNARRDSRFPAPQGRRVQPKIHSPKA